MPKGIQHETGLEENPKTTTSRVQHTPAFRKKLQDRQDALDKAAGKTRPSQATAEPKE